MSSRRGHLCLAVVAALVFVACSSRTILTATSLTANTSITAANSSPLISAMPVATDAAPVSAAVIGPAVTSSTAAVMPTETTSTTAGPNIAFSDAACALGPVPDAASITFVVQDRLWELSGDGSTATCIAALDGAPAANLRWSPGADAVLLGSNQVLDAAGRRDTGYLATNTELRWSYPTGKALIAPAVKDGALLWRSAADAGSRLDISFLADTTVATYHPAGKNVFAAGVDPNGVAGLFVASNRGENARVIALLDDPATSITEIAADANGSLVYFTHDHGSFSHVHQVELPSLVITDVAKIDGPVDQLTISSEPQSGVAIRAGDCASATRTVAFRYGDTFEVGADTPLAGLSTAPIGWIDADRLVVAARIAGCDGPADLWIASLDGSATLIAGGVDNAAVRAAVTTFGELPEDLNADAEY